MFQENDNTENDSDNTGTITATLRSSETDINVSSSKSTGTLTDSLRSKSEVYGASQSSCIGSVNDDNDSEALPENPSSNGNQNVIIYARLHDKNVRVPEKFGTGGFAFCSVSNKILKKNLATRFVVVAQS